MDVNYAGPPAASYNLTDYLSMLRRHWWIVLLAIVAGAAAGLAYNNKLPREYVSAASVLVRPAGQDANVAGGRTRSEINLDTEAQLIRSTAVVDGAAKALKRTDTDELAAGVSVEVPPNTSVLLVKFAAATPESAQAGARAFAESYLRDRENNARAELTEQTGVLRAKLRELNRTLNGINGRLAKVRANSSAWATLDSERDTIISQVNQLNNKINQLTTETVSAGSIIREARLPGWPVKPRPAINLAGGALLGLLIGLGLSFLRERLDRRVRGAVHLQRSDVAVLGVVPTKPTPNCDDVFAPFSAGGRAFNRLRNEVVAALRPGEQIVVVTGASRGPAATLVAANLAAALARTGAEVVLVGAHLPDSMVEAAPLARLLGVAPTPGLSDLLAGRVGLAEATQRAARNPSLHVITTGGTATAAGMLQSQALRDMIATLRAHADFLVIEAPSTATSADAQSLASLADAAILAVELRRTRRPEVVDATEQLRRVGTTLLGAVLLPKLRHRSKGQARPTPTADTEPAPDALAATAEDDLARADNAEPRSMSLNGLKPRNGQDQTIMLAKLDVGALAGIEAVEELHHDPAPGRGLDLDVAELDVAELDVADLDVADLDIAELDTELDEAQRR